MTEQERFEQHIHNINCDAEIVLQKEADGSYRDGITELCWEVWQAAQQKEGFVFVKPALDSAAKAKMIVEYTFKADAICPDCIGNGCDLCNHGSRDVDVFVPWTTIKQIYKDGVNCMIEAAREDE